MNETMDRQVPISSKRTVSVVIPCLNAEKYVVAAIDSALRQSLRPREVLVVDDGSSDGTLALLQDRFGSESCVKLMQHEGGRNEGVYRSRCLGVMSAEAEYIAFLDADDVFEQDKLLCQVELLEGEPDAVLTHSRATIVDECDAACDSGQRFTKGENVIKYVYPEVDHFLFRNGICNSSVLAKRDVLLRVFARVEFPQLFQYEDWLLWVLLGFEGPFVYSPELLVRYRLHEMSATSNVEKDLLRLHYTYLELLFQLLANLSDAQYASVKTLLTKRMIDEMRAIVSAYSGRNQGTDERIFGLFKSTEAMQVALVHVAAERRRLRNLIHTYERSVVIRAVRVVKGLLKKFGVVA